MKYKVGQYIEHKQEYSFHGYIVDFFGNVYTIKDGDSYFHLSEEIIDKYFDSFSDDKKQ